MTQIIVCDVCDEKFDPEDFTGLQLAIPDQMTLPAGVTGGTFDVCSWRCVRQMVDALDPQTGTNVETNGAHVANVQPQLPLGFQEEYEPPAEYEIPPTGVHFPEGIRVDGKDPSQLPRPTLKVKR